MIDLALLGTFAVRVEGSDATPVSIGTQRLLALLALRGRIVARGTIAGTLWPESSRAHAGESLRSALSRLESTLAGAIVADSSGIGLSERVRVDLHHARELAQRLLAPEAVPLDTDLTAVSVAVLSTELLPDWFEEWVLSEAEDWRQLRVSALEAQAALLMGSHRLAEAAGAARAAMRVDPLRESAHGSLIRVHNAGGNQSEALRVFERYRELLDAALGLEPTSMLSSLVSDIRQH